MIAMVGGDHVTPPSACPNCGKELPVDQSVCGNCGYIRPSSTGSVVPASSGIGGAGGAMIGCGGAFVAVIICMVAYAVIYPKVMPSVLLIVVEAILAVGSFVAFRRLVANSRHAREALIAFVIVFVVIGGGLASCVGMFSNFNVH